MTTCRADCRECDAKNIRTGTCGWCRMDLCEDCCRPDFEDDCGSECSNSDFDWCCMYCWLEDEAEGKTIMELKAEHRAPRVVAPVVVVTTKKETKAQLAERKKARKAEYWAKVAASVCDFCHQKKDQPIARNEDEFGVARELICRECRVAGK